MRKRNGREWGEKRTHENVEGLKIGGEPGGEGGDGEGIGNIEAAEENGESFISQGLDGVESSFLIPGG